MLLCIDFIATWGISVSDTNTGFRAGVAAIRILPWPSLEGRGRLTQKNEGRGLAM